jgi:hypothetical protein
MRTTVIIAKRAESFISTVSGRHGEGHSEQPAGSCIEEAAATAEKLMHDYALNNPEGGDLIAPEKLKTLVPEHLRLVKGVN